MTSFQFVLVSAAVVLVTISVASTRPARRPSRLRPRTVAVAARHWSVVVIRVIDGDTFVVAGGQRIRVLGIDAAERETFAGVAATRDAERLLRGQRVILTAEPGADHDAYGRALRYVQLPDGRDFGEVMVAARHTTVYAGRHHASLSYVDRLRALDQGGSR